MPCQGLAMRATTWSGTTANTLRFDRGGGWVQRWSDGGSVEVGVRGRVTKTGPVVRGGFDPKKTQ